MDQVEEIKKSLSSTILSPRIKPTSSPAKTRRRSKLTNSEINPKEKIYTDFVKKIMMMASEKEQLDFLMIYPIFKINVDLVELWKKWYERLCQKSTSRRTKGSMMLDGTQTFDESKKKKQSMTTLSKTLTKRMNMTRFIRLAYSGKFVNIKLDVLTEIMNLMKSNHEDPSQISCLKLDISKITSPYVTAKLEGRRYGSDPHMDAQKEMTSPRENSFKTPRALSIKPTDGQIYHIHTIDLKDLAIELTRQCHLLYNKITPHELLMTGNSSIDKDEMCPNFTRMVNMFNRVAKWIPTEILSNTNATVQTELIDRFIKLAEELQEINNFHLVMAIVAGLNNVSIQRLKHIWVNVKNIDSSKQMEETMSNLRNYKTYRSILENITDKTQIIPYMGVISRDMTFYLDGNTLINIEKMVIEKEVYQAIVEFVKITTTPRKYPYLKNSAIAKYIDSISIELDDDRLYKLSTDLMSSKTNATTTSTNTYVEDKKREALQEELRSSIKFTAMKNSALSETLSKPRAYSDTPRVNLDTIEKSPKEDSPVSKEEQTGLTPRINTPRQRSSSVIKQPQVIKSQHVPKLPRLDLQKVIQTATTDLNGSSTPKKSVKATKKSEVPPPISKSNSFSCAPSPKRETNTKEKQKDVFDSETVYKTLDIIRTLHGKSYTLWSVADVALWVQYVGMGDYVANFQREAITGEVLREITEIHLKEDLQINKLGDRLKFKIELRKLVKNNGMVN